MGVFDTITSTYNVVEVDVVFQTKSFDKAMDVYKIEEDGVLYKKIVSDYTWMGRRSLGKFHKYFFDGLINFYTIVDYKQHKRWIEYEALINDGVVYWIKKVNDEIL